MDTTKSITTKTRKGFMRQPGDGVLAVGELPREILWSDVIFDSRGNDDLRRLLVHGLEGFYGNLPNPEHFKKPIVLDSPIKDLHVYLLIALSVIFLNHND